METKSNDQKNKIQNTNGTSYSTGSYKYLIQKTHIKNQKMNNCSADKKKLAGKVALVTGASRGIGKAISIQLAQNDATVLLAATNPDKLQETAQFITSAGGTAESIVTDLRDETSIKRLVAAAAQRFGRLDILVNNAGVAYAGPIEDTATEQWDRCHSVNARGAFILCREALALLKRRKKRTLSISGRWSA